MNNITDTFIRVLNEAYEADPAAVHCLIVNRVPCNSKLADHPTIQVNVNKVSTTEYYDVGLLGVINGLVETATGERIAVMLSEPDEINRVKILGFKRYDA